MPNSVVIFKSIIDPDYTFQKFKKWIAAFWLVLLLYNTKHEESKNVPYVSRKIVTETWHYA